MKEFAKDLLRVKVFPSRDEMGAAAARDVIACFQKLLSEKDEINVIFAAAPSQNEVLRALVESDEVEWGRINAFHMDEYIGLAKDAPQGFGNFLKKHIFDLVPFRSVSLIDVTAHDPEKEAERYTEILRAHPADAVVLGIGENGHIAFNDPPVADFHDTRAVKAVKLDEVCRMQQVNDGCFASIDDVPTHALTLTVPTLAAAPHLFCVVPAPTKAEAVKKTLTGEIGEHCPATVLRLHADATLYLDRESAALL